MTSVGGRSKWDLPDGGFKDKTGRRGSCFGPRGRMSTQSAGKLLKAGGQIGSGTLRPH